MSAYPVAPRLESSSLLSATNLAAIRFSSSLAESASLAVFMRDSVASSSAHSCLRLSCKASHLLRSSLAR